MVKEKPYLKTKKTITEYHYNPDYGDERVCKCGHVYYRHFDSWPNMENEVMAPVGCKFCECEYFVEEVVNREKKTKNSS